VWYTKYQQYREKPLIALLQKDGGRKMVFDGKKETIIGD
jgi:hypothetical protein